MTTYSSASGTPLAVKHSRRKHWIADIANLRQPDRIHCEYADVIDAE